MSNPEASCSLHIDGKGIQTYPTGMKCIERRLQEARRRASEPCEAEAYKKFKNSYNRAENNPELEWRFNNRENPYLFRDTIKKLIESEHVEFSKLTA